MRTCKFATSTPLALLGGWINLGFVHPQKAGECNFFIQFHATHGPWEVIILGPVVTLGKLASRRRCLRFLVDVMILAFPRLCGLCSLSPNLYSFSHVRMRKQDVDHFEMHPDPATGEWKLETLLRHDRSD